MIILMKVKFCHFDSYDIYVPSIIFFLENKCVSPPLVNQLALFSRELIDLLKTAPHCQLLFNRFIPAYHHHFGRQCRVADYGFTKLIDLLEVLTHTVQVSRIKIRYILYLNLFLKFKLLIYFR